MGTIEIQRYTKVDITMKLTPVRLLVAVGILGMIGGAANVIYLENKINNEANVKYPISSSPDNNSQRIDYKSQLEHQTPVPGGIIFVSGFGLMFTGALIDRIKDDKKEKQP